MFRSLLVLIWLPLQAIAAQLPGGSGLAEEAKALGRGAALSGEVADSQGKPLPGARIRVLEGVEPGRRQPFFKHDSEPDIGQGLSDSEGRFEIFDLPAGRFDVEITAPGQAPAILPVVEIGPGQVRLEVGKVQMQPGARLQIRVTDPDGEPVKGAEVSFRLSSSGYSVNRFRRTSLTGKGITDRQGIFALADLNPREQVSASVEHPDFAPAHSMYIEASRGEAVIALSAGGRVFGRLTDSRGDPLSGTDLWLTSEFSTAASDFTMSRVFHDEVQTDAGGRFAFEHVVPGDVKIKMAASGVDLLLDAFSIAEGEARGPLKLSPKHIFTVTGKVLDAQRRPVEGALVRLSPPSEQHSLGLSQESAWDGSFRFEDHPVGRFELTASHPKVGSFQQNVDVGAHEYDFVLVLKPAGPVLTGQIVDQDGNPVEMATAILRQGSREISAKTLSRFRFAEVEAGEYRLLAFKPGYAHAIHEGFVRPDDDSLPPVELALARGARLAGRLKGLAPEQLSGVRIEAQCWRYTGIGQAVRGVASFDGSYRINGLAPGRWTIQAELSGRSVQRLQETIEVQEGQEEAWLDLDFGGGIQLSGLVLLNGRPLSGASLTLRSEGYEASGRLGPDGRILFSNLSPADYRLWIRDEWVNHQQDLSLSENREILIELQAASLEGLLLDGETGAPVAAAHVTATPVGLPNPPRHSVKSDLQGGFELPFLRPGKHVLTAHGQGYLVARKAIRVQDEPIQGLTVELQPAQPLVLKVRDWTGKAPARVVFKLLDDEGRHLTWNEVEPDRQGRFEPPYQSLKLRLALMAPGSALIALGRPADDEKEVILPQATILDIKVPELAESRANPSLILRGPSESSEPLLLRYDSGLVSRGEARIPFLLQGTWQVEVLAQDGRTWLGAATTRPDIPTELVLR